MNLAKKKALAAKVLGVGKNKILFVKTRIDEIKEAITRQDIRDLQKEGVIIIKENKGRLKLKKKKSSGFGNIRKKVNKRKKEYMTITRRLRAYIKELKKQNKITEEKIKEIRKKIRNKEFRSKAHLKEFIGD